MRYSLLSIATAAVCVAATTSGASAQAQSVTLTAAVPFAIAATPAATEASLPAYSSSVEPASAPAGAVSTEAEAADLPEAPAVAPAAFEGQAGTPASPSSGPIAAKYSTSILPGQAAVPLSAGDKVTFAFRDAVSPFSFLSRVVSATYSQGVDSQPHYGQGWGPYGQRVGAAFARGTVQTLATEAVFDPIFHDDPRYYVLGRQHNFFGRVVYAATRVVVTRTDSGHSTLNAPLLLGYAAASGANFAYYPEQDKNFHDAAIGYLGSLGGGVVGFEVSEFINDALHIAHLRR